MPYSSFWPLVLTSAAIAAVVSAAATLLGQSIERRARKRELLLTKALELAHAGSERTMRLAERSGRGFRMQDDIVSAETYFRWLEHLFDHGRLPDDPKIDRFSEGATPEPP